MKCILPYCVGDELEDGILQLITQRWWKALGELLQRADLSAQQRRRIIEEVIQQGDETILSNYFVRHCDCDGLDYVIQQLVTRCWWRALGRLLQRGDLSAGQRRHIIREVILHGEERTCRHCISHYCTQRELDYVIQQLVTQGWWQALGELLQRRDLSGEQHRHIIGEVILHGNERTHGHYISSHCARDVLDCAIKQLIKQGWWQTLHELLQRHDLSAQQRQHITDARKQRWT